MKKLKYLLLAKSIGLYINVLSFVAPKKAVLKAYAIFSTPRKGKIEIDAIPEVLKSAEAVAFDFNGKTIQTYIWKGNETVLFLIHGWESNSARWKKALPYLLKSGYTIVAIDAPAHGLSSGRDFNAHKYTEFIHHVAKMYNPKILIGHSIGGKACLHYQTIHQNNNVEKIVVLGAPSDFKAIFENYVSLLNLNSKVNIGLVNYYQENFNLSNKEIEGLLFSNETNLKGLIAHDMEDTVVTFAEAKKNANAWKEAEFIQTKGLGHSMNDEALFEKISSFITESK
ncbi:MAG: alpha/beta hydrolase [Flavobacterium sp.]|nr:alpha/beta hydrolase [Flavobacterium sp.]